MQITLTDVGKRFNREWIFRSVNYIFEEGKNYAITGSNGSGKSTLLQVISGAVMLSKGAIQYAINTIQCPAEKTHEHIAIAAPYLELIEEMTAMEFLEFHSAFKPLTLSLKEILLVVGLSDAAEKQIRYYSSGMKQRLKLAQAIFSKCSVLLLDEPTTNLDTEGIALYHQLIGSYCNNKLIIISSNDPQEYSFCDQIISISAYK
ncbi:MAG: ABC transporter ATP-binding protein [Ferruginibacter sp.]